MKLHLLFSLAVMSIFGCQLKSSNQDSGILARESASEEPLRATSLKLKICKKIVGNITEEDCVANDFVVTKKYFSGEDENELSMMKVTTSVTLNDHHNMCFVTLKRDFSGTYVDDEGNIIVQKDWLVELNKCDGDKTYMFLEEEQSVFDAIITDLAADYVGDPDDYCQDEGGVEEFSGYARSEVDLGKRSGAGTMEVLCKNGGGRDYQKCEIVFELDENNKIDLDTVEVDYCDY